MSELYLDGERIEKYSLRHIMKELSITKAKELHNVMLILLSDGTIPSEFKSLIEEGDISLTESLHWVHEDGIRVKRVTVYTLFITYGHERLTWNDYAIVARPYGKSQHIMFNEDFINTKMADIKELLKLRRTI